MTTTKVMKFQSVQPFSMKDRMKILFGAVLVQEVSCEITARMAKKEIVFEEGQPVLRAMLRKPQKQVQ